MINVRKILAFYLVERYNLGVKMENGLSSQYRFHCSINPLITLAPKSDPQGLIVKAAHIVITFLKYKKKYLNHFRLLFPKIFIFECNRRLYLISCMLALILDFYSNRGSWLKLRIFLRRISA